MSDTPSNLESLDKAIRDFLESVHPLLQVVAFASIPGSAEAFRQAFEDWELYFQEQTPSWPFTNLMSSRMITGRTLTVTNPVDGSTSTQIWKYASTVGSGWAGSPNSGKVTVTDPLNNTAVHTFALMTGSATLGQPICGPYET